MPIISLQIGQLTTEQKKEFIEKITDAAAEVTNISKSSFTVLIHELGYENIGVGGKDLATLIGERKS